MTKKTLTPVQRRARDVKRLAIIRANACPECAALQGEHCRRLVSPKRRRSPHIERVRLFSPQAIYDPLIAIIEED